MNGGSGCPMNPTLRRGRRFKKR